jgi:hypothetical protein
LLSFFVLKPIPLADFKKQQPNGTLLITSSKVSGYLDEWSKQFAYASSSEISTYTEGLDKIFQMIDPIYQHLGRSPLTPEIILSIIVLHKTPVSAKQLLLPDSKYEPKEQLYDAPSRLIQNVLHENGWCKHELSRMDAMLSSIGLYFLLTLGPRKVQRDHRLCAPNGTVDWKYAACEFRGFDGGLIAKTIRDGKTPLMVFSDLSQDKGNPCKLVTKAPQTKYVALSHIWADGMANEMNNKLPTCLLRKVQHCVTKLYSRGTGHQPIDPEEHVPFWIDSCSIPVESQFRDARKLELTRMVDIYRDADKVLVWDRELLKETNERNMLARAMLICGSVWWTRLWTLQEGVLAKELWFQLKDGAIPGQLLWQMHNIRNICRHPAGSPVITAIVLEQTVQCFAPLWKFREAAPADRMAFVWSMIAPRATSHVRDEPICLSTLVELDETARAAIVNAEGEDRMRLFLKNHRTYPFSSTSTALKRRISDGRQSPSYL